jgi:alpha-L-fucosidase
MAGLYYCSWDNHHKFGQLTFTDRARLERSTPSKGAAPPAPYVTREYEEFQTAQLEELLTGYGRIGEVWIDIPRILTRDYRNRLYAAIARWQPNAAIMMNHGIGDGSQLDTSGVWPTDLMAIERLLPNSHTGHERWRTVEGKRYYIPGEVCEPIGKEWFWVDGDTPRPDAELLGIYLVSRSRGANLLLDVPPDRSGLINPIHIQALARLRKNLAGLGMM